MIGCIKDADFTSITYIKTSILDDIYDVSFDFSGQLHILSGYVWTHGVLTTLDDRQNTVVTDTFSNKGCFDLLKIDNDDTYLTVGADGYLFRLKPSTRTFQYFRLSNWDILSKISPTSTGYIAYGGKAFETGYIYHINKQMEIDSVQYFGHEISDLAQIDSMSYITCGWGNIMRSSNAGKTWQLLPMEGDLYMGISMIDHIHGYIIGANGSLLETRDAGLTWQDVSQRLDHNNFDSIRSIRKFVNGEIIITGTKGRVWRSIDNGQIWKLFQTTRSDEWRGIIANQTGSYILYGSGGKLAEIKF